MKPKWNIAVVCFNALMLYAICYIMLYYWSYVTHSQPPGWLKFKQGLIHLSIYTVTMNTKLQAIFFEVCSITFNCIQTSNFLILKKIHLKINL